MKSSAQYMLSSLLALSHGTYGPSRNAVCCGSLREMFPANVFFGTSAEYKQESTNYWNPVNWVSPGCVFVPDNAEMVANAVELFGTLQCQFAVRSGGHSPVPGAASTQDGVLVAMTRLNWVDVKEGYVQIGPGNRWNDVYRVTDQHGVVVLGGRLGVVGVGGLVLGGIRNSKLTHDTKIGGLSSQASEHGLSCDTVRNYQIVTADGKLRDANSTHDPELFWALKGGSNQYGIVTRFDMDSYPLGNIYAGTIMYPMSRLHDVVKHLSRFTTEYQDQYPKASVILNVIDAVAVLGEQTGTMLTLVLYYGEPLTAPPDIFKPFFEIPGQYSNTVKLTTMSSFASANSYGITNGPFRQYWRTMTYRPSARLEKAMTDMFTKRIASFRKNHPNIKGAFTWAFEPVSTGLMRAGQSKYTGNAVGLDPSGGPLVWIVMTFTWIGAENDELVINFSKSVMGDIARETKRQRRFVDKYYLNDAAGDQPVFEGYGKPNFQRLRDAKRAYDPRDIFGTLQSGGFRIPLS